MRPTTWAWPAHLSAPAAEPLSAPIARPIPACETWTDMAARAQALDFASIRFGLRVDTPSSALLDLLRR